MKRALLAAALGATATFLVCPALAAAADDDELPHIDPQKDIHCFSDGDGRLWRVQCTEDAQGKRCLFAPNAELDEEGRFAGGLERARACYDEGPFDQDGLKQQGFALQPAIADAPSGWLRDRRGRVFQVEFDLHRRLYAGVSWAPGEGRDGVMAWDRVAVDFELFEWQYLSHRGGGAVRHRLQLVRGDAQVAPFGADVTLLHYDLSRRYPNPLFRITTFFGTPRRHDIDAHLGGWFELGHLEIYDAAPGQRESLWRLGTAALTWDVWRSADLYSYLRLRGGVGLERTDVDGGSTRGAVTPHAAVDADITFDQAGFHHLTFEARWERPTYHEGGGDRDAGERAHVELGYEVIVLAVNDQPLTLRLGGEGDYRGDIPGQEGAWDVRGLAGLRFSLWAPAR